MVQYPDIHHSGGWGVHEALYAKMRFEKNLVYETFISWETVNPSWVKLVSVRPALYTHMFSESSNESIYIYELPGAIVLVQFDRKKVHINIATRVYAVLEDEEIAFLQKLYPEYKNTDESKVRVNFHYSTGTNLRKIQRDIIVPPWEEIKNNYPKNIKNDLEYLCHTFKPQSGGQLIIWQGPSGVGKSYALRALIHEWKSWCTAEYVLDPEELFGKSSYLAELLLKPVPYTYEEEDILIDENAADKWSLLILEDCGELLTADAKDRTGQGLSRLLNLVDGLIGQGLKVLVLITTNEEISHLHPAVSREGRCAAFIKFTRLTYDAAQNLLDKPLDYVREYSLAEIYALKEAEASPLKREELRQIGFQLRDNKK